jgi:3-oxoacyl-[acyl-carrier protein] reductase
MDLGLTGKNAIVTGGSKGIGRCAALGLAEEGANVGICARGQEALDTTAKEIEALGVKVYAAACDVAQADSLSEFLNNAKDALGGVDVLVNNTSGFSMQDDEAGWKASFDIDLMGTVRATHTVTPWMAESGGGSIVHISSISGLEAGSPPSYAAVKAALINHAKTMAQNLAPMNIRVNCIAPGSIYFEGGFWDMIKQNDKGMHDEVISRIPFGRMGSPEEVADAIVYLSSSRASWVSGATLVVDGVQHPGIF